MVIGATATFTPNSSLATNTTYTATIAAGVVDLAGNPLASNFVWTFTTGATAETAAPTVSSTNPVNGATGVGIDASINATFDETMDTATFTPVTFTLTGPGATVVAGQVTYDVPDMIVTFTPARPLAASTTFTAALTGALDLAGNLLQIFRMDLRHRHIGNGFVADRPWSGHQFRDLRSGHGYQRRRDSSQRRSRVDTRCLGDRIPAWSRERNNSA